MVPRETWRGQFHAGTSPVTGASRNCPIGVHTGCLLVDWPGMRTNAQHGWAGEQPDIDVWYGGLVDGMRDASGQMYMRNRYYDPATGQFTQTDPIGIAGGMNVYGFAAGDPVSYSDPYGLSPDTVPDKQKKIDGNADLGFAGNRVRNRCGSDRLCRDLITHYALGDGSALRLSDATFQDVVRVAADAEVTSETSTPFMGTTATAKVINFYGTRYENSLGRATVFYNAQGEAIGLRDRVDFEARDWGVRPLGGEMKTRAVDWALSGTPFQVNYIKRDP